LWFRKAAEQGDAGAQFQLAAMYCTGQGVVRNLEEAVKWYRRAAEQGDRYAQYNLAVMLLKGQGAPQDEAAAFYWCSAAAEQGLAEAEFRLGDLYRGGRSVGEDLAIATAWYEKAAEQGHVEAAGRLGCMRPEQGKPIAPRPARTVVPLILVVFQRDKFVVIRLLGSPRHRKNSLIPGMTVRCLSS
jgi:uncharacterized protein